MKIFLPVAFGLSWLAALPLWLGGGLTSGPFRILATIMMFTPTLGVLAVWASKRTPFRQWARETGLTFGPRPGRTVLVMVGAWLGTLVVIALALLASVALGLITLDFHFRTFEAAMRAQGAHVPLSVGTLVLVQLVAGAVASPLLNAIPTFGEEWGWRGWLLPNLVSRFGTARALVLSGVIWGLWHAPLTLLGYNYPNLGPWAMPYFVVTCVFIGILFGWMRLRTGSVWPSVVAHGTLNGFAGAILLVAAATPNLALAGITGVVGWVLMGLTALLLFKLLPVRQADPVPAT